MSQYGNTEYWQQRYNRDQQHFDWYQRYFTLRDLIGAHIPIQFRILNVGAGLSQEMYDDGYDTITNIDISQASIKTMGQKYKDKGQNFKYIQMDVRAMNFPENSFDAVIDKGTLDSVLCGQGSNTNANKMLSQIYRVLNANGVYFLVTYGLKDSRLQYLQKTELQWHIEQFEIIKPTITATILQPNTEQPAKNNHHIYICTKGKKIVVEQTVIIPVQQKQK